MASSSSSPSSASSSNRTSLSASSLSKLSVDKFVNISPLSSNFLSHHPTSVTPLSFPALETHSQNVNLNVNDDDDRAVLRSLSAQPHRSTLSQQQLQQQSFLSAASQQNTLDQPIFRSLTGVPSTSNATSSTSVGSLQMQNLSLASPFQQLQQQAAKQLDFAPSNLLAMSQPTHSSKHTSLPALQFQLATNDAANTTNFGPTASSASSSSSSSSDLAVPICPSFVERSSSFVSCASSPHELMASIVTALRRLNVDCVDQPLKHKIKCVHYCFSGSQRFVIRLYQPSPAFVAQNRCVCPQLQSSFSSASSTTSSPTSPPRQQYVVEFQKRSGCSISFNYLYKQVRGSLTPLAAFDLVKDSSLTHSADDMHTEMNGTRNNTQYFISSDASLPIPTLIQSVSAPVSLSSMSNMETETSVLTSPLSSACDSEAWGNLYSMTSSLECEGACSLANMSSCALMKAVLSHATANVCAMVSLLSRLLSQQDMELTRSAAIILANCCTEASFRQHLISGHPPASPQHQQCGGRLFQIVFNLLEEPSPSCCYDGMFQKDIKRHVAKAVALLADTETQFMQTLVKSNVASDFMSILQKSSQCHDEQLQASVKLALNRLVC